VANWLQMIIVIRHAQSEGNKNRDIHQMIPDHRVKLTEEGRKQVNYSANYGY
jgi:broad specificity phosphatase PhoE